MAIVSVVLAARSVDGAATLPARPEGDSAHGQITPDYESAVRSLLAQDPTDVEVVLVGASDAFGKAFKKALGKPWAGKVRSVPVPSRRRQSKSKDEIDAADAPPPVPGIARARNAGVVASDRVRYVAFLDPGDEWGPAHLEGYMAALDGDPSIGASYGRYTIHRADDSKRTRPSAGKRGRIFEDLIERRRLFYTPSALMLRRGALVRTLPPATGGSRRTRPGPFDEALDGTCVLDLLLRMSRDWEIAFVEDAVPVRTPARSEDEGIIERRIRIFIGMLYGPRGHGPQIEKLVRGRLAHELTALGKVHYRRGDFDRAGRLFHEAAKAAPGYFKGRRYQFLNFVREKLASAPPSEDEVLQEGVAPLSDISDDLEAAPTPPPPPPAAKKAERRKRKKK